MSDPIDTFITSLEVALANYHATAAPAEVTTFPTVTSPAVVSPSLNRVPENAVEAAAMAAEAVAEVPATIVETPAAIVVQVMSTDHDRIVCVENLTTGLTEDMKEIKPRLRRVEDMLLQAKTAALVAKAVLGLVSVSVLVQVATLLHWHLQEL